MTAALALVDDQPSEEAQLRASVEPLLRRLHITLMGIQADAIEATNIVRSERAKVDLEKGIKDANRLVVEVRKLIGAWPAE